jgi:hypothetical protein
MFDIYQIVQSLGWNSPSVLGVLFVAGLAIMLPFVLRTTLAVGMLANVLLLWWPHGAFYVGRLYDSAGARIGYQAYLETFRFDIWWVQLGYALVTLYIFLPLLIPARIRARILVSF